MTTNQYIKPVTAKTEKNLTIGGCDTVDLAHKYGTPLYVIDEATLRAICSDYKKAFERYSYTKMLYASKALCTSAISKILTSEGFGFDTVSAGEIYTILNSGISLKNVLFNGNNKSEQELDFAIKNDIGRISVDNFLEVKLISKIAGKYNKNIDVLLRITPGIECHTHEYIKTGQLDSKFGFDLTQLDKVITDIITNHNNIKIRGLHAHIGSQIFEPECFRDEIDILIQEISCIKEKFNIKLDEINIGGGLGVKYTEKDLPPSVNEIADVIINSLEKYITKYNVEPPTLYIEPGRSLISTAGVTLYTIGSMKQVPNMTKYITVDGGMADNPRPGMYRAEYCADIANKMNLKEKETVTVAGRFCESGDILIKDISLPKPETGDILCIYNTGAYNYSMASNYNRVEKPAMVLVNNAQSDIIINRETLNDIVSHDVIPDRLK
ncbi:MAG: diaminopimelate decarboxylase [Candidatus Gastranaerophilales bacterium]|nr:diaminopimelate decarboxylase [Candidatus Gastranaerophilales bacterium]